MAFTLPAAAALLAVPFFLIDGLFTRGAFTADNARSVAMALVHYGWGVPAFVLARVYAPAFFAREDTRAPMRYAIASMALNIAIGAALFFAFRALGQPGFPGLAIGTSAAAWVNAGLMIRSLAKRDAYGPTPGAYGRLLRIGLASGVLFALLALANLQRPALEALLGSKEAAVALVIFAGGTVYFACVFLFRAVTIGEVRAAFRRERGPQGGAGLPPGLE
jgi:putative peptidoglycan lipid II flippase